MKGLTMRHVCERWYVRDKVNQELDDKILKIVNVILDDEINEECYDHVLNVMQEFIDITDWTSDEVDHAVDAIQLQCALRFAIRLGAKIDCEGLIEVIEAVEAYSENSNNRRE